MGSKLIFFSATPVEAQWVLGPALNLKKKISWKKNEHFLFFESKGPLSFRICVTGMGPERAAKGAHAMMTHSTPEDIAVGIGLCGGLSPALKEGDLVIPKEIWSTHQKTAVSSSPLWQEFYDQFNPRLSTANCMWMASEMVADPTEKVRIHASTKADAVDMESQAWFEACRERRVPFVLVKSVLDTQSEKLPLEFSSLVDGFGRPLLGKTVSSLLRNPGLAGFLYSYRPSRLKRLLKPQSMGIKGWVALKSQAQA